ncbi:hypothetical protein MKX03_035092 [Papaver bracteatum]|nr:hypothetical protein MKX03_035092 [Papaver bracteatum]
MEHSLWGHLPLLMRSNSKESIEYIFQALWRTRKTGLDSTDRDVIKDMLQLDHENDLDPLLVCLRMLIRRCINENDIQKLFPREFSPELQRLLTILFQKFQGEWRNDEYKDQMTWSMADHDTESTDPAAVINLKLLDDTQSVLGETEVKFQVEKDTLQTMLKSMYCIRDQLSNTGGTSNGKAQETSIL